MYFIKKTSHCFLLVVFFAVLIASAAMAQADKIEGLWYNREKSAKVEITKGHDNRFYGKVVWLKEPLKNGKPKVDEMNTEPALRIRPRLGLQVLSGFEKDGEDKYDNGTIYDPLNGKTYSCKMTCEGGTLNIRGYIGISIFGRTTVWTKAEY